MDFRLVRGDKSDRAQFAVRYHGVLILNAGASHLSRASLGWQMKQNVVSLARSTTNRGNRSSAYREAICGICHPRLCNITQNVVKLCQWARVENAPKPASRPRTNRIGRVLRVAMPPAEHFNTFKSHPVKEHMNVL